jgi:hypothetical protein
MYSTIRFGTASNYDYAVDGRAHSRSARCRSIVPARCGRVPADSGRMTGVRAGESPRPLEASRHFAVRRHAARGRAASMAAVRAGESP